MVSNLLYTIGEAIILNDESIEYITYPKGEENPTEMIITDCDGKRYRLLLSEISNSIHDNYVTSH